MTNDQVLFQQILDPEGLEELSKKGGEDHEDQGAQTGENPGDCWSRPVVGLH
jgi:hypothetical protein